MEFTFMKNFKNIKNKNIKNIFAISAIAVSAIFSNNFAFAANADDVEITDEFVRLNAPNAKATGAFMNIKNKTNAEIKIISAENTVSQKTELHTHMEENGVKKLKRYLYILIGKVCQAENSILALWLKSCKKRCNIILKSA